MTDPHAPPPPIACATCGVEYDDWSWDGDDWVLEWEWWGKRAFHCSRWCYINGAEHAIDLGGGQSHD